MNLPWSFRNVYDAVVTLIAVVPAALWAWITSKNWFHPVVLETPLVVMVCWLSNHWWMLVPYFFVVWYSAGHHAGQHHRESKIAIPVLRWIWALCAIGFAYWIGRTGR